MNPQSKVREFWLFKNGVGCANPDYQSLKPDALVIDDFIHVIEFEAYRKAVEALKVAQKENEKLLKFKEEMWKLGQAMPPNAISMMIQRELGKFGETNSSRVGG